MNLEERPWPVDFQAATAPRSILFGFMRLECMSLGCWCSESLGLVLRWLFPVIFIFVLPNPLFSAGPGFG